MSEIPETAVLCQCGGMCYCSVDNQHLICIKCGDHYKPDELKEGACNGESK